MAKNDRRSPVYVARSSTDAIKTISQGDIIPSKILQDGYAGTYLYYEQKCKLCNSEYRGEAEAMFRKGTTYQSITDWLLAKDVNITYRAVNHHMKKHYDAQENAFILGDYANDVLQWVDMNDKGSAIDSIKRRMAVIEREFHTLAAESDSLKTVVDRQKNAEQVRKIADTLLGYQVKLNELVQEKYDLGKLATGITNAIEERVNKTSNEAVKIELISLLEDIIKIFHVK